MKRLFATIVVVMAFGLAAPISASSATESSSGTASVENLKWARRMNFYYYGSSANPLSTDTCGRVINGVFIFSTGGSGRVIEVNCTVPSGMPLLASPNGVIVWYPTDGTTPAELKAARDKFFATLTHNRTTLDGTAVPVVTVKSYVHPMKLQPGNLIQQLDPAVTGTSTLVATGDAISWIRHLSPGRHDLVTSTKSSGTAFRTTYHLTVR